MKTLNEIKNQTTEEALTILQEFVNTSLTEPYDVDEGTLQWVYNKASEKIEFKTPISIEEGFKLYELDIEYCSHKEAKNCYTQFITVYVAESLNEDTGEYTAYFAL